MELGEKKDVVPYPATSPVREVFRQCVSMSVPFRCQRERDGRLFCRYVRSFVVGLQVRSTGRVSVSSGYVVFCYAFVPRFDAGEFVYIQPNGHDGNDRGFRNEYQAQGFNVAVNMRYLSNDRIVRKGAGLQALERFFFGG